MKRASGILCAACAIACMVGGWSPVGTGPGDEEAIKAIGAAFAAAWNKDDAAGMSKCWATDGDLINPWGRVANGRAAVETLFQDEHAGMMKDSHYEMKMSSPRMIGGGSVALVDWDSTITWPKGADGTMKPPFAHHVAIVMEKMKDGAWSIQAARPYQFAPKPDAVSGEKKAPTGGGEKKSK
jgi:uncharacterized protein (TIGR02246 family)